MKAVTKVASTFDRALTILVIVAGILLAFAWLSVVLEVVMRYFLNRPQVWVVEISEYILVWLTFLGAAWLLKEEGHVKMDLLLTRLNPRMQSLLNLITSSWCILIWLALTWYSGQVFWHSLRDGLITQTGLELPRAPIYAIIPIGSFLLFIQFLRRTYGFLEGWRASPKLNNIRRDNS